MVQRARDAFNRGVTRPIAWRKKQLKNLLRMYEENKSAMVEALHKDLRRSKMEALLLEVDYLVNDLVNTIHHLDEWVKPEKVCGILVYNISKYFVFFKKKCEVSLKLKK